LTTAASGGGDVLGGGTVGDQTAPADGSASRIPVEFDSPSSEKIAAFQLLPSAFQEATKPSQTENIVGVGPVLESRQLFNEAATSSVDQFFAGLTEPASMALDGAAWPATASGAFDCSGEEGNAEVGETATAPTLPRAVEWDHVLLAALPLLVTGFTKGRLSSRDRSKRPTLPRADVRA
jgi:hypothetical protein